MPGSSRSSSAPRDGPNPGGRLRPTILCPVFRPSASPFWQRAHGLAVLDRVHLDLSDDEGFAASCRQGRELGIDGKTLIHPKQISAANPAFPPPPEGGEWSRPDLAAPSQTATPGQGRRPLEDPLI